MTEYFSGLNYLAVVISGIVFFFIGFIWYSFLFGKAWVAELSKRGMTFDEKPSKGDMAKKMVTSLISNIIIALALAVMVKYLNLTTLRGAFHLALLAGVGLTGAVMMINYNWQGHSFKLFLIDWAHQFVGIFISCIILVNWRTDL